eukprot:6201399-Pleurochrysis_carterae.AAC.1
MQASPRVHEAPLLSAISALLHSALTIFYDQTRLSVGCKRLEDRIPAAQGEGSVAPSAHACPIGHGSHSSPLANFVRFEYVPAPHGCGVMVPSWRDGQANWRACCIGIASGLAWQRQDRAGCARVPWRAPLACCGAWCVSSVGESAWWTRPWHRAACRAEAAARARLGLGAVCGAESAGEARARASGAAAVGTAAERARSALEGKVAVEGLCLTGRTSAERGAHWAGGATRDVVHLHQLGGYKGFAPWNCNTPTLRAHNIVTVPELSLHESREREAGTWRETHRHLVDQAVDEGGVS